MRCDRFSDFLIDFAFSSLKIYILSESIVVHDVVKLTPWWCCCLAFVLMFFISLFTPSFWGVDQGPCLSSDDSMKIDTKIKVNYSVTFFYTNALSQCSDSKTCWSWSWNCVSYLRSFVSYLMLSFALILSHEEVEVLNQNLI